MKTYHVWITLYKSSHDSKIINGLVLKGYVVSAANGKTTTTADNNYQLMALRVEKDDADAKLLYDDVSFVLTNLNTRYCSVVISEYTQESAWCGTNIIDDAGSKTKALDKKLN